MPPPLSSLAAGLCLLPSPRSPTSPTPVRRTHPASVAARQRFESALKLAEKLRLQEALIASEEERLQVAKALIDFLLFFLHTHNCLCVLLTTLENI